MNTKPAIASCLALFMLSTTTTAAQAVAYWTPWVSEDNNGPWVFCGPTSEAVSGFECADPLCGSVRARCETMPFSSSMQSFTYSDWFSEEDIGLGQWAAHGWYGYDDSYSHVCRWNGAPALMTGIHCQGLHCNNIQIECGAPANLSSGQWAPAELYDCHWTGYYSNEDPAYAPGVGANRYIAGVRCNGPYCDNKSFYTCRLVSAAHSCSSSCGGQAPGGCWCDHQCQNLGDCCANYEPLCTE